MKKPTKAQWAVLERMAAGSYLRYWPDFRTWLLVDGQMGELVHPSTGRSMKDRGWVEQVSWKDLPWKPARPPLFGIHFYRLTDATRAALGEGAGEHE